MPQWHLIREIYTLLGFHHHAVQRDLLAIAVTSGELRLTSETIQNTCVLAVRLVTVGGVLYQTRIWWPRKGKLARFEVNLSYLYRFRIGRKPVMHCTSAAWR